MNIDHIKRMYNEAQNRIHDANILSRNVTTKSDAHSILKILGFEILLKCTLFACNQTPKSSHNYYKLWLGLPGYAQKEILEIAKDRMTGLTDFSDLKKLLDCYKFNFEKARYFYELYEDYTLDEQHELGEYWVEIGAPTEEADVQYHPYELDCLIYGLSKFIEEKAF